MAQYTLVVVESPAKAKTISKYLGSNYVVRPTVGHIIDLSKGKGGDIGVDIKNNFKPKYADIPDKKDVIKSIVVSAKSANNIIIASDPDREGEAIAFHVVSKLESLNKNIKRAEFHEITKNGVQKGLNNLRDLDINLYNAQQARRVLDRIVGFMVSPYLINKFNDKLSAGRVQSVALRLIVDREKEIKAFVPEEYWTVTATLSNGEKFIANYPDKIKKSQEADKIKSYLDGAKYEVLDLSGKEQKKYPYPPFNTADLQKAAAVRYRFSADKTIKAAQSLYESGLVTYIRSDSYRCSDDSIKNLRTWLYTNDYDVPKSYNVYKNKNASQDAHEAIRPTDVAEHPEYFIGTDDQKKIYGLIWQRFVASQMCPAVYDTVNVTVRAYKGTDYGLKLKANGRTLKYKGWMEILQDDKKDKNIILPVLSKGEQLKLVTPKIKVQKKSTKPPPRYNDGSLIDELKKKEIGRPSTYAAILSKILTRKYVNRIKNHFEPTVIGCKVVDDLVEHFSFMKYEYTALMEKDLDKMSIGNADYLSIMTDFFGSFKDEFNRAKNSDGKDAGIKCPLCNDKMIVRHSQYGYFAGCIKYPDCRGAVGVRLDGENVIIQAKHEIVKGIICPKCNSEMIRRDGNFGPFYSCSKYPKCFGKRKIPFGKKCSKCKIGEMYLTVFNSQPKLACMEYPKCKNVEAVPENVQIDWVPPEKVVPKSLPKQVNKILKG